MEVEYKRVLERRKAQLAQIRWTREMSAAFARHALLSAEQLRDIEVCPGQGFALISAILNCQGAVQNGVGDGEFYVKMCDRGKDDLTMCGITPI